MTPEPRKVTVRDLVVRARREQIVAAATRVFAQATFLVSLQQDLTLLSAATAVAATLNVIGPGLGQVGASENFGAVNAFGRVVLTG